MGGSGGKDNALGEADSGANVHFGEATSPIPHGVYRSFDAFDVSNHADLALRTQGKGPAVSTRGSEGDLGRELVKQRCVRTPQFGLGTNAT